jgi:hypothetical protein
LTAGTVKLLLPPRQSRGISLVISSHIALCGEKIIYPTSPYIQITPLLQPVEKAGAFFTSILDKQFRTSSMLGASAIFATLVTVSSLARWEWREECLMLVSPFLTTHFLLRRMGLRVRRYRVGSEKRGAAKVGSQIF